MLAITQPANSTCATDLHHWLPCFPLGRIQNDQAMVREAGTWRSLWPFNRVSRPLCTRIYKDTPTSYTQQPSARWTHALTMSALLSPLRAKSVKNVVQHTCG